MALILTLSVVVIGVRLEIDHSTRVEMEGLWLTVLIGGLTGAAYLGFTEDRRAHGRTVRRRAEDEPPPVGPQHHAGHPYRARLRRAARVIAPPLSGRSTVVVVAACMAVTAVVLPLGLGLPRLVEAELVLVTWWSTWVLVLSGLLYRGWRLSDDFVLRKARLPFSGDDEVPGTGNKRAEGGCAEAIGCADMASLGGFAVAAFILIAIFAASWFLVELVVPLAFFLVYTTVRGALARVANDDHDCEGHAGRAFGWALLWSSVYMLPLALLMGLVHAGLVLTAR